jgi:cardiolipin synthase
MRSVNRLARCLRLLFRLIRAASPRRYAALSDAKLAGMAQGMSYALQATRWQRRSGLPRWDEVHARWATQCDETRERALWACLDPRDRWDLVTGNAEAFDLRDDLYRQARSSIDLATFYIQADATGWRTAHALAESARRGVRVRVLVDGWATQGKAAENPAVLQVLDYLRAAGVDCRVFTDRHRPFDAWHSKLLLVDGTTLLTGGRNYADHYAGGQWRDVELRLCGPSVASLVPVFEAGFLGVQPTHAATAASHLFHATTPAGMEANAAFIYLLQRVRACRSTLDIENAYLLRHAVLHRELVSACRRGVRVRVFTNSAESNDLDFMNYRLYAGFPELMDGGVELYLQRGQGRTLHCKYFIADGEWVGFGSSNLDFYSPRFCHELGLHVRDAALASRLTAWFEAGIADGHRLRDRGAAVAEMGRQGLGRLFDRWCTDIQ